MIAGLRASLAAFDDAALATLANAGLVRRAHRDLAEGKVRLMSATTGKIEIEADGQLVTLDARGPRAAVCACKSIPVCRHRLAAVLFLRDAGDDAEASTEIESSPESIVLDLDLAALERWAGKAGWRAALELAGKAERIEPLAQAISVSFADLDGPVRILRGQGFDGIVSKASKARVKALHAAAVLAARRHFGEALPVIAAEVADAGPVEVDPVFLARIGDALGEVATLGFNLAPLPLEESLFELSVSSRADNLPRLAAILRVIAAQIQLRRGRALAYDSDSMLELAATAFALTQALANPDPARRVTLAGKVRRDFAPAPALTLVGCGGERWRTDTGARGVTAWFLEPDEGRWLSTTLARGAGQDPGFQPGDAWRTQPMWHAEPLATLAHARIELTGARRSPDDRLSAPAEAQARIVTRETAVTRDLPGVVDDWRDLRGTWLRQTGLGLDTVDTAAACLLAPVSSAPPYFDDLEQQLVWPLGDVHGRWLALTLDHEEPVATAIEALEAHVRSGWRGLVLVRLARIGAALEVRPITLFGEGAPIDLTLWQKPYSNLTSAGAHTWLQRLRSSGRRFGRTARGGSDAVLASVWRALIDRAEIGHALGDGATAQLEAQALRLDDHGMPTLARQLRRIDGPRTLLAAVYAVSLARQQRCAAPLLE